MEGVMGNTDKAYLEYELSDGTFVILQFDDENQRDGCHISLDMYKVHLGAVDDEVLERIVKKFQGQILTKR
jgi:hypothetical protein